MTREEDASYQERNFKVCMRIVYRYKPLERGS